MPRKIFVVGGVRSGKSAFAEREICALAPMRLYVATMQAQDAEMECRIARHRELRGAGWLVAEPGEYAGDLAMALTLHPEAGCILVDSLGSWLSGLLCGVFGPALSDADILARVEAFAKAYAACSRPVAVVSDETGLGLVPMDATSRRFCDLLGLANQRIAREATHAYLVSCGLPLRLGQG